MGKIITIGTFNIQNNSLNRKDTGERALLFKNLVINNKFDYLGTQELTKNISNNINKLLSNTKYKMYGEYRYKKSKIFFNENNLIFTNKEVQETKTIWLPYLSKNISILIKQIIKKSIFKRIVTIVIMKKDNICMINTHLDFATRDIKLLQLEKLKQIVLKYSQTYNVILTGDFNMQTKDKLFQNFCSSINLQHIENEVPTWKGKKSSKVIDHIFIPKNWTVQKVEVINNSLSDHNILSVRVKQN